MLDGLRAVVGIRSDEYLLLLHNNVFVGLVRENAQLNPGHLRAAALCNLLRQSVAAACTALDTFVPSLLRANIGTVLAAKGRDFLPTDKEARSFFQGVTFTLEDTVRLLNDPDSALFIANRIIDVVKDKGMANVTGIHAVGSILGVEDPWCRIGERLDRNPGELRTLLSNTVSRRNDIIHRSDRSKTDPDGPMQEIALSWTMQAVDNIKHVCTALDELVGDRMRALRATPSPAPVGPALTET